MKKVQGKGEEREGGRVSAKLVFAAAKRIKEMGEGGRDGGYRKKRRLETAPGVTETRPHYVAFPLSWTTADGHDKG